MELIMESTEESQLQNILALEVKSLIEYISYGFLQYEYILKYFLNDNLSKYKAKLCFFLSFLILTWGYFSIYF